MLGIVTTEAINPLYIGAHAVGPYIAGAVTPSGIPHSETTVYALYPYIDPWNAVEADFAPSDAASNCSTGGDGTESAPQPVAAGGWWTAVLSAHGHTAWTSFAAQAGRSAPLEDTGLDEGRVAPTPEAIRLLSGLAA